MWSAGSKLPPDVDEVDIPKGAPEPHDVTFRQGGDHHEEGGMGKSFICRCFWVGDSGEVEVEPFDDPAVLIIKRPAVFEGG